MAEMEASNPGGLSREALEKELSSLGIEELKQMGTRVARSMESFEEMFDELKSEQQALREENAHLNDTISMMMKEMQKLHISSDNCVTPQLVEDPLNFVGRWWDKVKPRDTAVPVSEHVGEIKKPVTLEDGGYPTQTPQQVGKEVVQKAWGALGPLWQKTQGLVNDAKGELAKQVNEHSERQRQTQEQQQSLREKKPKRKERHSAGNGDASSAANAPPQAASSAAASSSTPAPEAEAAELAAAPAPAAEAPSAATTEPEATPAAPAAGSNAAAEEERTPGAEEQIASTILIEARIKLDDGSTQTLQLRAADRCKEVSQRFIAEHSLKVWFQEPLTTWLKQVEADAVKFPVEVEADLMEIRKQHAKK